MRSFTFLIPWPLVLGVLLTTLVIIVLQAVNQHLVFQFLCSLVCVIYFIRKNIFTFLVEIHANKNTVLKLLRCIALVSFTWYMFDHYTQVDMKDNHYWFLIILYFGSLYSVVSLLVTCFLFIQNKFDFHIWEPIDILARKKQKEDAKMRAKAEPAAYKEHHKRQQAEAKAQAQKEKERQKQKAHEKRQQEKVDRERQNRERKERQANEKKRQKQKSRSYRGMSYQDKMLTILGLNLTEKHTQKQIKKAYRRMAQKVHPDRNPDDTSQDWAAQFNEVQEAYEWLQKYYP